MFNLGSRALGMQFGRELTLEPGDAIALSDADRGSVTTSRTGPIATLEFPQGALMPMLKDVGRSCGQRIQSRSPALRLLWGYLETLRTGDGMCDLMLQPLAISHIYDLAAVALGASRGAEETARGRGIRAARLQAIRTDVLTRLDRGVSVTDLATRHGVSSRYVRMLFQGDGTTFTDFVREARLRRAHSMLLSRHFDGLLISEIAYRVGFDDLSYFNRAFRRRFGRSPGEVREGRTPRESKPR